MSATESVPAVVDRFLRRVRVLVRSLEETFPEDATVVRAVKRIRFACEHVPAVVIRNIGYYLYQYREQVVARDLNFFISTSYDSDIQASVKQDKADFVQYLIPRVKDVVCQLDAEAQLEYSDIVLGMFDDYLTYLELTE